VRAHTASADLNELWAGLPVGVQERLQTLLAGVGGDVEAFKAGLESWFDASMQRLEGAFKRHAQLFLFAVGLIIAIAANASAIHVATRLWNDDASRVAVADSAGSLVTSGQKPEDVQRTIDALEISKLPLGWDPAPAGWDVAVHAAGWLATAFLVMLGAPFWFDLLSRFIALRGATKPDPAADDSASATKAVMARPSPGPASTSTSTPPTAEVVDGKKVLKVAEVPSCQPALPALLCGLAEAVKDPEVATPPETVRRVATTRHRWILPLARVRHQEAV